MQTFRKLPTIGAEGGGDDDEKCRRQPVDHDGGGARCLGSTGSGESVDDCDNRDATVRAQLVGRPRRIERHAGDAARRGSASPSRWRAARSAPRRCRDAAAGCRSRRARAAAAGGARRPAAASRFPPTDESPPTSRATTAGRRPVPASSRRATSATTARRALQRPGRNQSAAAL